MEIGLLSAFIGGALALLSPCAALLLPAFFAASVGTGPKLLLHGAVFYLGTLLILVPMGLGVGAIGALFTQYRPVLIGITAVILVALGIVQLFGFGFDPAKFLPGGAKAQQRASTSTGLAKTLLLGVTGGVAGFCVGPILGAVLTFAATSGSAVTGGLVMAVYGAGMVVPLLLIAALWNRLGNRGRRALRGRAFTFLGREWHTTSVVTGVLLVIVGVLFWMTNGFIGLPQLVPSDIQIWLQSGTSLLANPIVDSLVIGAIAIAAIAAWITFSRRRNKRAEEAELASEPEATQ